MWTKVKVQTTEFYKFLPNSVFTFPIFQVSKFPDWTHLVNLFLLPKLYQKTTTSSGNLSAWCRTNWQNQPLPSAWLTNLNWPHTWLWLRSTGPYPSFVNLNFYPQDCTKNIPIWIWEFNHLTIFSFVSLKLQLEMMDFTGLCQK